MATIVWCGVFSFVILKVIDAVLGLRINDKGKTEGLDLVLHDERGYNFQSTEQGGCRRARKRPFLILPGLDFNSRAKSCSNQMELRIELAQPL
ncbi:MAG: ammonium transporter [Proteobacteria bacterium]|nr:ammonium transporter [Pseudomonadota bacterium]